MDNTAVIRLGGGGGGGGGGWRGRTVNTSVTMFGSRVTLDQ